MSSSPTPSATSSTTDTPTSDAELSGIGSAPAYNYFFLLILVFGLICFGSLMYFSRRRKIKNARLARNGRDALARDVESWTPRRWGFRTSRQSADLSARTRNERVEQGLSLDERGEAPPPYGVVGGDKPPPITSRLSVDSAAVDSDADARQAMEGGVAVSHPPAYEQSAVSTNGDDVLTRPATAIVPSERSSEVDLEEQSDLGASTRVRASEGWHSMRRLMGTTNTA